MHTHTRKCTSRAHLATHTACHHAAQSAHCRDACIRAHNKTAVNTTSSVSQAHRAEANTGLSGSRLGSYEWAMPQDKRSTFDQRAAVCSQLMCIAAHKDNCGVSQGNRQKTALRQSRPGIGSKQCPNHSSQDSMNIGSHRPQHYYKSKA
jgi:hypothetical protein